MEETSYFSERGFLVTSTRIDIDGQTFAVRNISSVKVTEPGRPWLGALLGFIAAGAMSSGSYIFGTCVGFIAAYLVWLSFVEKRLVLVTSGGEIMAIKSTDGRLIERLRHAIAQALSVR